MSLIFRFSKSKSARFPHSSSNSSSSSIKDLVFLLKFEGNNPVLKGDFFLLTLPCAKLLGKMAPSLYFLPLLFIDGNDDEADIEWWNFEENLNEFDDD
ncbi:hypothetical protein WICMUC_001688 [Wickerhamomyces mucosus]|uniref:Uncharacterized protein n=1 Tax=Wickerhamomyces mucosus TaxID=1378264 RepID=A0A9P8TGP0_9ASCO|nr:hypothetical protein WICMUC_001688 [Wickerhamomyces mucosus]